MLASEPDAARFGGREPRLDVLPNKIALELGKTSHDGAHEPAARRVQVESQAMLPVRVRRMEYGHTNRRYYLLRDGLRAAISVHG